MACVPRIIHMGASGSIWQHQKASGKLADSLAELAELS